MPKLPDNEYYDLAIHMLASCYEIEIRKKLPISHGDCYLVSSKRK
uniref:Uncharacterized protein n=1 Tax=Arundo donax TaxID=35708 RepID=A0A0A9GXN5_ARUDO